MSVNMQGASREISNVVVCPEGRLQRLEAASKNNVEVKCHCFLPVCDAFAQRIGALHIVDSLGFTDQKKLVFSLNVYSITRLKLCEKTLSCAQVSFYVSSETRQLHSINYFVVQPRTWSGANSGCIRISYLNTHIAMAPKLPNNNSRWILIL